MTVQGNQNKSGNWDLSFSGSDTYDYGFNFSDYSVDKFGIGANVLYGAQQAGVVTPFETRVNFKEKDYSLKQKKKNESKKK